MILDEDVVELGIACRRVAKEELDYLGNHDYRPDYRVWSGNHDSITKVVLVIRIRLPKILVIRL